MGNWLTLSQNQVRHEQFFCPFSCRLLMLLVAFQVLLSHYAIAIPAGLISCLIPAIGEVYMRKFLLQKLDQVGYESLATLTITIDLTYCILDGTL